VSKALALFGEARPAEALALVDAPGCRVLILGTVPGAESLRLQQYCANPRNAFWRIMSDLFGWDMTVSYQERLELVRRSRLALWDVLASADRPYSSLDWKIRRGSEVPNDIAAFAHSHPDLTHVFLNGAKAAALFDRHVRPNLVGMPLNVKRLPSTSPANAALSYEAKLDAWRAVATATVPQVKKT
jgi:hypoxanthine-DNA glycosylase